MRPEWTPDGKRIVFVSNRSGEFGTWWRDADGGAPPEKVFESKDDAEEVAVAPDGRVLVYRLNQAGGDYGVWFGSLLDFSAPQPVVSTSSYREFMPNVSPDGRWLAHVTDETGASEVYVRAFPGSGARQMVSAGGGSEPRWSPDGRRLFYRSGRAMIAARVTTAPQFSVTGRDTLFEGDYLTSASHRSYDVTSDGREFLMIQRDAGEELIVVINWFTELRARIHARVSPQH
jgi:serine/threonine-protein kinase